MGVLVERPLTPRRVRNRGAKGRKNEHKSRALLEAAGYFVVRAAGSKGPWDLVALGQDATLRPSKILLVQVKTNRIPPRLSEEESRQYPDDWRLVYHVWKDYARSPVIISAR